MKKTKIDQYHRELKDWDKSLSFYVDEIGVFKNRMREIVGKNTGVNVLAQAEHFQNQFILQKEHFDLLHHDMHKQETMLEAGAKESVPFINGEVIQEQLHLRERVHAAEKIFIDTKHEFYRFLSNVL